MHCHLDIYFPPWQYVCHCLWWTVGGNRRSRPWFYQRSSHIGSFSKKNPGFSRVLRDIFPPIVFCQVCLTTASANQFCLLYARKYSSAPIKCCILHRGTLLMTSYDRDYIKIKISLVSLKCWYIPFKKIISCEVRT